MTSRSADDATAFARRAQSGFTDLAAFSRAFIAAYGVSPSRYEALM